MGSESGFIIPFAKPAGITSFASMAQVKKALGIKKAGHTGTLDNFADGLLVILTGRLTKLASCIEAEEKTYKFAVKFGIQTDTLDPSGKIAAEKPLPAYKEFLCALKKFNGKIKQIPPEYSALKIRGVRASDRVRAGEHVEMKGRTVCINSLCVCKTIFEDGTICENPCSEENSALPLRVKEAVISVCCSKGTYVRALARDIAAEAGSCAYLTALRRTKVGAFNLENAAGFNLLPAFCTNAADTVNKAEITREEIEAKALMLTPSLAEKCSLPFLELDPAYKKAFFDGQKINSVWFSKLKELQKENAESSKIIVFLHGVPVGAVQKTFYGYKYSAVFRDASV